MQHTFHIYDGLAASIGNADDQLGEESVYNADQRDQEAGEAVDGPQGHGAEQIVNDFENADAQLPIRDEEMPDDDLDAMQELPPSREQMLEDSARTPLFTGSGLTLLGGTLLLLNCLQTHVASNLLVNEIFAILHKSMLPDVNSLPSNEYHASKVLKQLELAYETIHYCPGPQTCILFRGEYYKDLTRCPICNAQRFKQVGKSRVPIKVLRHFPLIPRLQRMYSTRLQASYMTWHQRHVSEDGIMRGAVDSHQWKFVKWKWHQEFAFEARNLRLGLATVGVNPFSVKCSTWSTWPVLIMNYNLPPWMTTKKHFVMLSLIIPGKKSVTGDNFDTYLQPLLEKLKILWHTGVQIDNAAMYQGSARFSLKAILLWTMHDFPTYRIVAGCVTKGYRGCHICGENTVSRRSLALHKNVYDNHHRRFLPCGHPWRSPIADFNGIAENKLAPAKITAEEIIRAGELRQSWVQLGATPASSKLACRFQNQASLKLV